MLKYLVNLHPMLFSDLEDVFALLLKQIQPD